MDTKKVVTTIKSVPGLKSSVKPKTEFIMLASKSRVYRIIMMIHCIIIRFKFCDIMRNN